MNYSFEKISKCTDISCAFSAKNIGFKAATTDPELYIFDSLNDAYKEIDRVWNTSNFCQCKWKVVELTD